MARSFVSGPFAVDEGGGGIPERERWVERWPDADGAAEYIAIDLETRKKKPSDARDQLYGGRK